MPPHILLLDRYLQDQGKIGVEATGIDSNSIKYQLSQRADFFEEEVGLETTLKRPIINTRDEPHADATKYRRLHVICGDANMSETANILKVGSSSILLAMIEDDFLSKRIIFDNPVRTIKEVSHDLSLKKHLILERWINHYSLRSSMGDS